MQGLIQMLYRGLMFFDIFMEGRWLAVGDIGGWFVGDWYCSAALFLVVFLLSKNCHELQWQGK